MSKSIIQSEKRCFMTGRTDNLDKHHIFFGTADRKLSEKYGLWVWLCHDRHIHMSPHRTPHNDREVDLELKQVGQKAFEEEYPYLDFMSIFYKNYLGGEDD